MQHLLSTEESPLSLMVQGFQEGLDISPEFDSRASEPYGNRNGFELLRQLTREFSLRNRAEAIALRHNCWLGFLYRIQVVEAHK